MSNGTPKPDTLTLSKQSLVVSLQCSGQDNQIVPSTVTNVCVDEKENTIQTCKTGPDSSKQIKLQSLLGAREEITWTKDPPGGEGKGATQGENWILRLNESQLPSSDKQFFVGCIKKDDSNDTNCKLTVKVEAPPSAVKDNVVSCAYGHTSNPSPVKVELTQGKNSFTLVCGKDGTVKPATYNTDYSEDASLEDKSLKKITEILPTFDEKWWTAEKEQGSVVLTIPQTDFPSADKTFFLGCSPTASTSAEKPGRGSLAQKDTEQAQDGSTTCRVEVTVKAGSSPSSASGGALYVAAAAGTTALAGLLSGTM
ncbi:SAG-related sequence [Besnoitia besnoiti]|uniref:SAG-related sequence n=1 Tax=Besnoitia besnoiti TaxID=94643 RepID=A0A2A9MPL6_BESBE|nr:SAG-related sequence [Besnoitia besnoiti]PFH37762.1 SAG-related sequence [Besnoitia besnoiti]